MRLTTQDKSKKSETINKEYEGYKPNRSSSEGNDGLILYRLIHYTRSNRL